VTIDEVDFADLESGSPAFMHLRARYQQPFDRDCHRAARHAQSGSQRWGRPQACWTALECGGRYRFRAM